MTSSIVLANPFGGVLSTSEDNQVYLNCLKFEEEECLTFSIVTKKASEQFSRLKANNLKSSCLSQISKRLGQQYHQIQNLAYEKRYFGITHLVEKSCTQNSDKPMSCIFPIILSSPLNLPFIPFIAGAHGVHKLFTLNKSSKYKKHFVFMLNKNNFSKSKKISNYDFQTFDSIGIYNFFADYSIERECVENSL